MKIGKLTLVVMATAVALNVWGARVLRLQGSEDMTWDNTTATWLDENDSLTTYSGSWGAENDAVIGGPWFTGSKLTLNFWCHAGKVVFTNSQNLVLATRKDGTDSPAFGGQTKSLQKWGTGMLTVDASAWMYNTCDWELYAGTLTPSGSNRPASSNGAWLWGEVSATHRPRINVWGGVLEGHGNESFGKASSTVADEESCADVVVSTNGTFRPGITANCVNTYPLSFLHDLTIDGGTVDFSKKGYWGQGLLAVYHKLSFSGLKSYSLSFPGQCGKLALSIARQTEINVADITGNADADVTLADANIGPLGSPAVGYSAGLKKTGAGTLVFSKQIKNSEDGGAGRGLIGLNGKITVEDGLVRFDANNNKNEGDIEVTGGTLRLGSGQSSYTVPSNLGETFVGSLLREGRTITASGTGRIYFAQRNMFYYDGGTGVESVAPATFVAKDGGELVVGALDWTGTQRASVFFPNLRLENEGKVTLRDESGDWPNGSYGVMGTFSFGGTAPITVPAGTGQNHVFLLNSAKPTVFEVEDITGDPAEDATFTLPMGRYVYQIAAENQKPVGFRKTGAGTFRVNFVTSGLGAAGVSSINGTINVDEGTLQIDDGCQDATLAVSAGAFVSGTGKVRGLTLADGAGFVVKPGQEKHLSVSGAATIAGAGVVDIIAEGLAEDAPLKVAVVDFNGTLTGSENLSDWKVRVNGVEIDGKVLLNGKTLMAKRLRGMKVIVR